MHIVQTTTKEEVLKSLEKLPMNARVSVLVAVEDVEDANKYSPEEGKVELGLTGEFSYSEESICFTTWAKTK